MNASRTSGSSSSGRAPDLLFLLVLGACAWVLLSSLSGAPRDPHSDDGYYLRFMSAVCERGPAAFRGLFQAWNADPASWNYPSPLRAGFISVSAIWALAFGPSLEGLARLSAASHLLLVAVTYAFARRHFGAWRAALAAASLAFSPLLLGLARLALADSFAVLSMSIAVWTYFGFAANPASPRPAAAFALAFAFAILVKEAAVVLTVPFLAIAVWDARGRGRSANLLRCGAAIASAGALAAVALVLAAGSPARVLETARIVLSSPETNRYAVLYGSGPWSRYAVDFVCLSPWISLLAVGACGAFLAGSLGRPEDHRVLGYLALVLAGTLLALSFLTKNVRYAAVLETPIRILAVCLLAELSSRKDPRRAIAPALVGVAVLCWLDWRTFDSLWVRAGLYDPMTTALLAARSLVQLR